MDSEKKNRPKDGWRQLDFKTIICIPNAKCAAVFFSILFVFSLIMTSVILSLTYQIIEKSTDTLWLEPNNQITTTLTLDSSIKAPVYIYVMYYNYYQNHRIYLKSKSKYQLANQYDSSLSTYCTPLQYWGDLSFTQPNHTNGSLIVPCGLIPASFYNLTINAKINNTFLDIDSSTIAWWTDNDSKYVNQKDEYLNITDQHFKVWMRTSATNTLRKAYGKVTKDLEKGNYTFTLSWNNTTNFADYNLNVKIVLSTTTAIGGKNMVFGWTFFVVMVMSFFWAVCFILIVKYEKPTNN